MGSPDVVALTGLLADDDRRRVFAALVLGAANADDVARTTGLSTAAATRALGRLVDGGLVVAGSEGGLHVVGAAFAAAVRAARAAQQPADEHGDSPPQVAKVLRTFVSGGRITQIPTSHNKRLVLLEWLAEEFEPGRRYSEKMVNLILGKRHADTAAWRRYLVDEGFLDRHQGQYWRSGGPVDTRPREP